MDECAEFGEPMVDSPIRFQSLRASHDNLRRLNCHRKDSRAHLRVKF